MSIQHMRLAGMDCPLAPPFHSRKPSCLGASTAAPRAATLRQATLAVNLRQTYPTAIGLNTTTPSWLMLLVIRINSTGRLQNLESDPPATSSRKSVIFASNRGSSGSSIDQHILQVLEPAGRPAPRLNLWGMMLRLL